jgi:hypothetical protein
VASPFPGMDPYLEKRSSWSTVHWMLISILTDEIGAKLPLGYWVEIDRHAFVLEDGDIKLLGRPDTSVGYVAETQAAYGSTATVVKPVEVTLPQVLEVNPGYILVKEGGNRDVITAIEVLSPVNKRPGPGRTEYIDKRNSVLATDTNLVEIDLLRTGHPLPLEHSIDYKHYSVLVSRAEERPKASMFTWWLPETPPTIPIPLKSEDSDVQIDLAQVISTAYERSHYDRLVDYSSDPPLPALQPEFKQWLDATLRDHGLR